MNLKAAEIMDVTVDTVSNELTDKIVEEREVRTGTVVSSCGDKEKEVDNTPVEIEMLQAEDASFVKESLGIGSYSVCARLVSFEDMEGKGGSDLLPGSASMAYILKLVQIWLLHRNLMRRSPRTIHEC